jgi:GWxTD domain-containing protein
MNIEFVEIDLTNKFSSNNFYVSRLVNHQPFFNNYIKNKDTILVEYNNKSIKKMFLSYFPPEGEIPMPPYSSVAATEFQLKYDSLKIIEYKQNIKFATGKEGVYYFQADTSIKYGFTIGNFGEDFPYITSTTDMLKPLQYLVNPQEFKQMNDQSVKKLAVDNFWLSANSEPKISKELIRVFYSRVFYANLFFTNFKPGWQTDRGMIYTVLGPPKVVNKTNLGEVWVYSDSNNMKIMKLVFEKKHHPFSEEHFVLQRNLSYKPIWDEAVKAWRNGKIYSFDVQL